jgi:D-cysteine desulfhydrase
MAMTDEASAVAGTAFPLYARFPRLGKRAPRFPLHDGPSPVSPLDALSDCLGAEVWLKNDGLYGTVYGGNKPRKLEFVLADALREGAKRVATTGVIGTNHGLATAIYGKQAGLAVSLLLAYEKPTPENRRLLLQMAAAGADIHYTRSYPLTAVLAPYYIARFRLHDGRMPYILGPGGSSSLAALGYVNAAFELARQVEAGELPAPRSIVVPLGTGGTVAGLLAGLRLANLDTRIVAVSITRAPTAWRPAVMRLARSVLGLVAGRTGEAWIEGQPLDGLDIVTRWIGDGLGHASPEGEAARVLAADMEGLNLDSVYTAKSMAALIGLASAGALEAPVLFWHTHNTIQLSDPPPSAAAAIPRSLRQICGL